MASRRMRRGSPATSNCCCCRRPTGPRRPAARRGEPVLDVLVVGAGMYGIAATAALTFKGLRNILMLDRAPAGRKAPG